MAYGEAFNEFGAVRDYNSLWTTNLGDGLWVTVPNISTVNSRGKRRELYAFNLEPNPTEETVRIVARHILPRRNLKPEPMDHRRNEAFRPEDGLVLRGNQYPKVLTRTFSILGLGLGNVEALLVEQNDAIEEGWLCRVSDDVREVLPPPGVMENIRNSGRN